MNSGYVYMLGFLLCWVSTVYAGVERDTYAMGWHWYAVEPDVTPSTQNSAEPAPITLTRVKETLETYLNQAILNPTVENVTRYITLQNAVSQQSSKFAQVWQDVLRQQPALNYNLTHPTNHIARKVYLSAQAEVDSKRIKSFMKEKGIFFFYKAACPYCKSFAPILKRFAEAYAIEVVAITLDHETLPEFTGSHVDEGQAHRFNVTRTPAVFLVDPYEESATPLAYGLVSESELAERILRLTKQG